MDFEELLKGRVCECGMTHTCAIKHIIIGKDANKKLAPLLEGYKKVLLVADTNTYAACGETIITDFSRLKPAATRFVNSAMM